MKDIDIIPFGKYKGQPVDVLKSDKQYVEWLSNQDWFKSRYQQINNVIINNFTEPTETPEHNKLTAKFLNKNFQIATVYAYYNVSEKGTQRTDLERCKTEIEFEITNGSDIFLKYKIYLKDVENIVLPRDNEYNGVFIECKPIISDDYPAIVRQCRSQKSDIIFFEQFTSSAVSIDEVKAMFKDIKFISIDDVIKYKDILDQL